MKRTITKQYNQSNQIEFILTPTMQKVIESSRIDILKLLVKRSK